MKTKEEIKQKVSVIISATNTSGNEKLNAIMDLFNQFSFQLTFAKSTPDSYDAAKKSRLMMDEQLLDNKINLLEEDLFCIHKYLDDINIPRKNSIGENYSIVGRIKRLRIQWLHELSKLESEILLKGRK